MDDRSLRSFFVDGIKYILTYDPDTDHFFIQPVPRDGSDFFKLNLKLLENSTVNLISQEGFLKSYQSILKPMERFKQERSMISIRNMEK